MGGLIRRGRFLWPETDCHAHPVIERELSSLDRGLSHTTGRALAIQAGGNVGVWPAYLAERFETVVTVEPEPVNYECLRQNVPDNVRHRQAAFGAEAGHVAMELTPQNAGAHWIRPGGGEVPMVTIDSLSVDACDIIVLDVEGSEFFALQGAVQTVAQFRPVIQFEQKGLGERYFGLSPAAAQALLQSWGYRVVEAVKRDLIMVPA